MQAVTATEACCCWLGGLGCQGFCTLPVCADLALLMLTLMVNQQGQAAWAATGLDCWTILLYVICYLPRLVLSVFVKSRGRLPTSLGAVYCIAACFSCWLETERWRGVYCNLLKRLLSL